MRKKITTRDITVTALLLAICILFQSMKGISAYLTGSAVNCILILAVLYCGLFSGTCIAVLTPVIAYFIGATPIVQMIPWMLPVIMLGNELLVLSVWVLCKKRLEIGMMLGTVLKTLFLWLTVWFVILPILGGNLPQLMITTVRTSFSLTQLVTAVIGSVLAWCIYKKSFKEKTGEGK